MDSGHAVYFKLDDKIGRVGCLEGEKYLKAIFVEFDAYVNDLVRATAESDDFATLLHTIIRALYRDVANKILFGHLRDMLTFGKDAGFAHVAEIESELNTPEAPATFLNLF